VRLLGNSLRRRPWTWLAAFLCLLAAGYLIGRQVWAEFHFHRAEAALDLSLRFRKHVQLAEAREHLDCALTVWPDDSRLHFLLARVARRAGHLDEAAI